MSRLSRSRPPAASVSRWLPVAAVTALLGAAMVAAVFGNPTISTLPSGSGGSRSPADIPTAVPPQQAPPDSLALPQDAPREVSMVGTWLCVAAVAAVLALLLWLFLRDRFGERRTATPREADQASALADTQRRVRMAVDEGLADLDDADLDPRRAVIACWARLEAAAAAAGTAREPGDTSTDLVGRLLAAHRANAEVLAGLAAVYREARFATHTVDQTTRERARAALRLLRAELSAGTPWPAGA